MARTPAPPRNSGLPLALALAAAAAAVAAVAHARPYTFVANVVSHAVLLPQPRVSVHCPELPGLRCRSNVEANRVVINVFHDPSTIENIWRMKKTGTNEGSSGKAGQEDVRSTEETFGSISTPRSLFSWPFARPDRVSESSNELSNDFQDSEMINTERSTFDGLIEHNASGQENGNSKEKSHYNASDDLNEDIYHDGPDGLDETDDTDVTYDKKVANEQEGRYHPDENYSVEMTHESNNHDDQTAQSIENNSFPPDMNFEYDVASRHNLITYDGSEEENDKHNYNIGINHLDSDYIENSNKKTTSYETNSNNWKTDSVESEEEHRNFATSDSQFREKYEETTTQHSEISFVEGYENRYEDTQTTTDSMLLQGKWWPFKL